MFLFVCSLAGHLLFVPILGAGLLLWSLRLGGVSGCAFWQSWKACFTAMCSGLIVMVGFTAVLPREQFGSGELLALQLSLTCVTHLAVIALLLRKYSVRALLAQAVVVLVINLAMITLSLVAASGS